MRNNEINPSGYYRIYQYFREMNDENIMYRELVPDYIYKKYHFEYSLFHKFLYIIVIIFKSLFDLTRDVFFYKPDIVIINREICPKFQTGVHYWLEKKLVNNAYVIWDFDDAIMVTNEISKKEWDLLENCAEKIALLSDYLKQFLSEKNQSKVDFIPTTDGDYAKNNFNDSEIREKAYAKEVRIIWLATATNIPYLEKCIPYLESAAKIIKQQYSKRLILTCVCNKECKVKTEYLQIDNVKWDRKKALEIMSESHIGIMPLEDDQFTRGKGGFKLIQYMSASIPIVASNVGFNKEVVKEEFGFLTRNEEEWCNAIIRLSTDYNFWKECSQNAKKNWNQNFSYQKVYDYWTTIIH